LGYPPFFRSFGIKDLGGGSRQVFGFKGLTSKSLRTNNLAGDPSPSASPRVRISVTGSRSSTPSRENRARRGSRLRSRLLNGSTSKLPQSDLYRYRCGWRVLSQFISLTGGWDERGNVPSVTGLIAKSLRLDALRVTFLSIFI
jgi:hypothetical protein